MLESLTLDKKIQVDCGRGLTIFSDVKRGVIVMVLEILHNTLHPSWNKAETRIPSLKLQGVILTIIQLNSY